MYFIDISDIMAKGCIIFSGKQEGGHENSSCGYSTYSGHL
jgi:hypothetical protein